MNQKTHNMGSEKDGVMDGGHGGYGCLFLSIGEFFRKIWTGFYSTV